MHWRISDALLLNHSVRGWRAERTGSCSRLALDDGKDAVERRLEADHLALHDQKLALEAINAPTASISISLDHGVERNTHSMDPV